MSVTQNLNRIFGVTVEAKQEPVIVPNGLLESNKDADFGLARQAMINAIIEGRELLSESIAVAKESQSPRAFEVASGLLKTMSEISKDLIGIYNRPAEKQVTTETNITNQTLNITTADLSKMLDDMRKDQS